MVRSREFQQFAIGFVVALLVAGICAPFFGMRTAFEAAAAAVLAVNVFIEARHRAYFRILPRPFASITNRLRLRQTDGADKVAISFSPTVNLGGRSKKSHVEEIRLRLIEENLKELRPSMPASVGVRLTHLVPPTKTRYGGGPAVELFARSGERSGAISREFAFAVRRSFEFISNRQGFAPRLSTRALVRLVASDVFAANANLSSLRVASVQSLEEPPETSADNLASFYRHLVQIITLTTGFERQPIYGFVVTDEGQILNRWTTVVDKYGRTPEDEQLPVPMASGQPDLQRLLVVAADQYPDERREVREAVEMAFGPADQILPDRLVAAARQAVDVTQAFYTFLEARHFFNWGTTGLDVQDVIIQFSSSSTTLGRVLSRLGLRPGSGVVPSRSAVTENGASEILRSFADRAFRFSEIDVGSVTRAEGEWHARLFVGGLEFKLTLSIDGRIARATRL